jgi:hypothetical protein
MAAAGLLTAPDLLGAARAEPTSPRPPTWHAERLADEGPAAALISLSPAGASLTTPAAGPARVVFDKVHHAVISPARTPVLLIPTRCGAPHLLRKNEPGLPGRGGRPDVGVTLARSRLLVLTDNRRVRLCRLIVRRCRGSGGKPQDLPLKSTTCARSTRS